MTVTEAVVLRHLSDGGALLENSHFVFTSDANGRPSTDGGGNHGDTYCNVREVAWNTELIDYFGLQLARLLRHYEVNVIIGPESMGRTLAGPTALHLGKIPSGWCEMVKTPTGKRAGWKDNFDFSRHVLGKRVGIVDDLLTSGGSLRLTAELVRQHGGEVVAGGVVARRTPDIGAKACGLPALEVLADVPGFTSMTPEECTINGPCARRVPVRLLPGHGHEWIQRPENVSYPVVPLPAA